MKLKLKSFFRFFDDVNLTISNFKEELCAEIGKESVLWRLLSKRCLTDLSCFLPAKFRSCFVQRLLVRAQSHSKPTSIFTLRLCLFLQMNGIYQWACWHKTLDRPNFHHCLLILLSRIVLALFYWRTFHSGLSDSCSSHFHTFYSFILNASRWWQFNQASDLKDVFTIGQGC